MKRHQIRFWGLCQVSAIALTTSNVLDPTRMDSALSAFLLGATILVICSEFGPPRVWPMIFLSVVLTLAIMRMVDPAIWGSRYAYMGESALLCFYFVLYRFRMPGRMTEVSRFRVSLRRVAVSILIFAILLGVDAEVHRVVKAARWAASPVVVPTVHPSPSPIPVVSPAAAKP